MKLSSNALAVGIWSEDYKKLAQWYIDVLGFTIKEQAELPNDSYIAFSLGDNLLWIGKHDKVSGKNKDPYRIMIEFYVESVMNTYNELKEKTNITFIAEPFAEPTGTGNWCMTIADPEGNILQFYGKK
ncbi:MAG TPA: VOC family protein [Methylomirabilota bacterium]|nr:VOC family protein [Methylomirabilota bacterium]